VVDHVCIRAQDFNSRFTIYGTNVVHILEVSDEDAKVFFKLD